MAKYTVYWRIRPNHKFYQRIKERFRMTGMTVNGEAVADVDDSDIDTFRECARRGFFTIRNK